MLSAMAGPAPLWQQKIDGYADKIAIADVTGEGKLDVVVATDKGAVLALAGADGSTLWSAKEDSETFVGCPLVAKVDDKGTVAVIVVGSRAGTVLALNGKDGSKLWSKSTRGGDPVAGSASLATFDDGTKALLYAQSGKLLALKAADGTELWTADLGAKSDSAVTSAKIGDGLGILVGTNNGKLLCLGADGKPRWSASIGGRVTKPALVIEGADGAASIFAVGAGLTKLTASGAKDWAWSPAGGKGLSSGLAIGDVTGKGLKVIVVGSYDGFYYAVSPAGKAVWKYRVVPAGKGFVPGSTPVLVDVNGDKAADVLFTSPCSDNPKLIALNGKTGAGLWSVAAQSFSNCSPAVADVDGSGTLSVVFCVTTGNKGLLTAVKAGKAGSGWFKYNGDLASSGSGNCASKESKALAAGKSPTAAE